MKNRVFCRLALFFMSCLPLSAFAADGKPDDYVSFVKVILLIGAFFVLYLVRKRNERGE
jgi:hypothetical protein